jgi:hypothetical protein
MSGNAFSAFVPGPMRVPIVNGPGQPVPAKPVKVAPALATAPAPAVPNRIPAGKKGDCPICNRGFKRGGF